MPFSSGLKWKFYYGIASSAQWCTACSLLYLFSCLSLVFLNKQPSVICAAVSNRHLTLSGLNSVFVSHSKYRAKHLLQLVQLFSDVSNDVGFLFSLGCLNIIASSLFCQALGTLIKYKKKTGWRWTLDLSPLACPFYQNLPANCLLGLISHM